MNKISRIIVELKKPQGLNLFEAELFGDHCLNSTIAIIRQRYPENLHQEWERVPSRFNPDGVRVCRYWLKGVE